VALSGMTSDDEGLVNSMENLNNSNNNGLNFSNNLLFRHRFQKKGRTFSIGLNTDVSNRDGLRTLNSLNQYADSNDSTINQRTDQTTRSYTISTNISYTEPIGQFGQFQVNYSPSYRKGNTDKSTRNFDDQNQEYFNLDTALSNTFENTYIAQKGGLSYRFNNKKINVSTGLNFQYSSLSSDQEFPQEFGFQKSFRNVLPQASFNYRFSREKNLRIFYRTSTNAPSVNQLQNVLDNSNPLSFTSGNPNLKQEFNHSISLRYGNTNATRATSLFFFANASFTNNNITNATYLATSDHETINGIELNRGTQLSIPVNIDGYWNTRTFFTYGLPVTFLKSNLNLNTGFTYNSTPGLINSQKNTANNYNISQGVVLSSNISEKIDFNLSYTGNYSIVRNTLQKQSDNNYYIQNTALKLNLMPWKGLVLNTNVNHNQYWGLSESFNQKFILWNASIGYKMLKDRSLELKASVFDILNQNRSISRNVTETYIEDSQTTILKRYLMFSVTYNIRNFKKA
jgi:outer membrane receptor protein involved in Fe transport